MESPVRVTPQNKKHNIRQAVRGGILREVWDELDEDGNIVKTAVWDLVDRVGNPLGEQSWDEYEHYLDELLRKKQKEEDDAEYKKSPEYLDAKKKQTKERKYLRAFGKRDELMDILNAFLEDHPEEFAQVPGYRFREMIMPYMGEKIWSTTQVIITMRNHIDSFLEMGFTFGEGYSSLSRNNCTYVGYHSAEIIEDGHKKDDKYSQIEWALDLLPMGEYTEEELLSFVHARVGGVKANLLGLLLRNTWRWGLKYEAGTFYHG